MQNRDSSFMTEFSNPESMSYYLLLRETIHGLDKLIVTVIYQSVTIITGSLTLAVLFFEKIENPWGATILAVILTVIAMFLTRNSRRRVKLYSDILAQKVKVAEKLENLLFSDDSVKVTQQIEKNVQYAGMKGEGIFIKSMLLLYWIEIALLLYLLVALVLRSKVCF